jgi:hypothetical protein
MCSKDRGGFMMEGKIWYEEENKDILIDAGVILHAEPEEENGGYIQACTMPPEALIKLHPYLGPGTSMIFAWMEYNGEQSSSS